MLGDKDMEYSKTINLDITKWKKAADALMNPAGPQQEGRKRDLTEQQTAHPSAAKRARTGASAAHKTYNVVDVGQQVEVLQEELVAAKEELKALRDQHKREIDFLYLFLYSFSLTPLFSSFYLVFLPLFVVVVALYFFCSVEGLSPFLYPFSFLLFLAYSTLLSFPSILLCFVQCGGRLLLWGYPSLNLFPLDKVNCFGMGLSL